MAILNDPDQPNPSTEDPSQSNPEIRRETGPGPEEQHLNSSAPSGSNQGDSEMRNEMNAMKAQMSEMMRILLSLKSGNDFQSAQWPPYGLPLGYTPPANPEADHGAGPVAAHENVQPASVGSEGVSGEPRVQTPQPIIIPHAVLQGFTPQPAVAPQAQGFVSGNSAYPQVQHATPVMAPVPQSHQAMGSFPQNYSSEHQQTREQFQILEERLRMIEGSGSRAREARDLCLIPDVVLPAKFKVPDFDKYKGLTCPKSHLTMYCRKMSTYSHDDKLLIHCFQESLAGASLNWYMKLEPSQIRCWKDLADAFLRQYQYNTDMAPDRTQLQGMGKRDNESFKEYAQRWRALAAQVTPPLLEKELALMFLETLPPLYYDKLMSVSSSFSDMVTVGERLENGLRNGRIAQGSSGSTGTSHKKPFSGFSRKKEGETNTITANPPQPQSIPVPSQIQPTRPSQNTHQNTNQNNHQKNNQDKRHTTFDPIPMSYTDLFNYLHANKLISTRPMRPIQPPYFRGYDPNSTCAFHEGAVGHVVENCKAFKVMVQDMIDSKSITFRQENPSITTNPLPGHDRHATNAIMEGQSLIRFVEDVRTPLEVIHGDLCKFGVIRMGCVQREVCTAVNCFGACEGFKLVLQDLMDRQIVQIGIQEKAEDVLTFDNSRGFRKPIEVPYSQKPAVEKPKTIVIPFPAPRQPKGDAPWNFSVPFPMPKSQVAPDVTNIAEGSGVTRSGRVYAPEAIKEGPSKEEEERIRKGKSVEQEPVAKKKVSDQEASEFLKIMRQSDYKVVDQLHHTPAKISIMSLLLNSEAHRDALVKVLNEAHVAQDITVNQLDGIVGNIAASNYITFTDEELTPEGKGHNQALHISVRCGEYTLSRVLIDNGSSLNVMPKSTMNRLNVDCSYMKPSSTLVRAFDGSKKEVIGEIEFPMQIGPEMFYITFQIMDITSSYSCLLGRPWIHAAGAVPSSLHQRLKFVVDDKLIVVFGEEEFVVNQPSPANYIEAAEESFESAFQSLEIANAAFVSEETPLSTPRMSKADAMVAKVMLGNGYQIGKGLGKSEQGILAPVQLQEYKDRRGLGYWPTLADKKRMADEKREKRLARLQGRESSLMKIPICDLKQSFRSAGLLDPNQVAMLEEEPAKDKNADLVQRNTAGEELGNWKSIDFPVVFISK